jgi:hypothetical protein
MRQGFFVEMDHETKDPALRAAAGSENVDCLAALDSSKNSRIALSTQEGIGRSQRDFAAEVLRIAAPTFPSAKVSQDKVQTLLDDLTDEAGLLIDTLRCLPTQRVAGDVDGFLHSLRRAHGYWRVISQEARLLAEAHGNLLSALRQEGTP